MFARLATAFGLVLIGFGLPAGCTAAGSRSPTPASASGPRPQRALDLGGGVRLELVEIPAGQFLMGSPPDEPGRTDYEGPQHLVTFARSFWIGRYEVTQAQWQAVMGENPSWHKGADWPVTKVNWDDCQEFCRRLSARIGCTARLPSEAEWEYACRAGTTTAYSFGNDVSRLPEYAYFRRPDAVMRVQSVHSLKPNPWGLYHMHGNAWEWCEDVWRPSYEGAPGDGRPVTTDNPQDYMRVLRGGCWHLGAAECRSAARAHRPMSATRSAYISLRIVVE